MPDDDDRFLGLSPETAELWKSLGDTPDSKALKEECLRTQGALKRGSVADPDLCSSSSRNNFGHMSILMLVPKQQRFLERELWWKHYNRNDADSAGRTRGPCCGCFKEASNRA